MHILTTFFANNFNLLDEHAERSEGEQRAELVRRSDGQPRLQAHLR